MKNELTEEEARELAASIYLKQLALLFSKIPHFIPGVGDDETKNRIRKEFD